MYLTLKKVYQSSNKEGKPRLFLQHLICEAAGLVPGDELYVQVKENEQEIIIQNQPLSDDNHIVHVSSRLSKTSEKRRPLIDTAGDMYASILSIKQKIEIAVYKIGTLSKIVVRPLRFQLIEETTLPSYSDERIRLLSVCAGAGFATAALVDTQYFTPVQEIEYEMDSAEVLKHNYPNSYVFNGDLRDCNEVAESDVAFVSLPCNEFSSLGDGQGGTFDNLVIGTARIIRASKAKMLFFENVPEFYRSDTYTNLKEMLFDVYPYWDERNLESYDFGCISRRNRTYAVAFQDRQAYLKFRWPEKPKSIKHKKLYEYLDSKGTVDHEWKDLSKWLESFESKKEKDNAWANRSIKKTFVTRDSREIQCIPKRYRGQSSSSSFVLNEEGTHWRFLTLSEIRRILSVPEWFDWPGHTSLTRRYEMIGQGVDGHIIKAIGNRIATVFYQMITRAKENAIQITEQVSELVTDLDLLPSENGQLQIVF